MSELQIIENGLVPVYTTDTSEKVVDGRELWLALEVKTDFSDWIKKRFNECDAVENVDFASFLKKKEANNATLIDYIIKLNIAKEMAMLERNEKGKQVRKYFIAVEEKHNQQNIDVTKLPPEMQMFKCLFDTVAKSQIEQAEMQKQLTLTTEKVATVENSLSLVKETIIQRDDDWRKSLGNLFNKAVEASGTKDFQMLRQESYKILEERAHCDLSARLRNAHERLRREGATKTKISSMTKLDIIENDPKLKEIYTSIVKEFAIRYSA